MDCRGDSKQSEEPAGRELLQAHESGLHHDAIPARAESSNVRNSLAGDK